MKPRCARGHQKQDATSGHTKIEGKSLLVRGLNALAAAICPALGTPLIAATRLRGGNANAARGTASFAAEVVGAARAADAQRWSSCRRTTCGGRRAGLVALMSRSISVTPAPVPPGPQPLPVPRKTLVAFA
jgi:hypothetical protein